MDMKIRKIEDQGTAFFEQILEGLNHCKIKYHEDNMVFISALVPNNEEQRKKLNGAKEFMLDSELRYNCSDGKWEKKLHKFLQNNLDCILTDPSSVFQNMEMEWQKDQDIKVAQNCGLLQNDGFLVASATKQYWLLYMIILRKEDGYLANLLRYILVSVMEKMIFLNNANIKDRCQDENQKSFYFSALQKRWILLGNYADYYLGQLHLPAADLLTKLSAAKYEGSECQARIYFNDEHIETVACMGKPREICEKNQRLIRKLMEIAKRQTIYLFAEQMQQEQGQEGEQKNQELSLTQFVRETADDGAGNLSEIKGSYILFSGYMNWSVICDGKEEITYRQGEYDINCSGENQIYQDEIDRIDGIDNDEKTMLIKLAEILLKQKHGTAVIIGNDYHGKTDGPCGRGQCIRSEANRLCRLNRGIRIQESSKICYDSSKKAWDESLLLSVTEIDGALFMNETVSIPQLSWGNNRCKWR